jgi:uncharacterized protein (DUF2147 family)
MRDWMKAGVAVVGAVWLALAPGAVQADARIGVFQTTDRKMDYVAELCGKDETQLCVTLTAVRGSADIPRTRKYLGKLIVDHAKATGQNTWHGRAWVQGFAASGDIVLVPGETLTVSGCVLMVACGDFMLIPAR